MEHSQQGWMWFENWREGMFDEVDRRLLDGRPGMEARCAVYAMWNVRHLKMLNEWITFQSRSVDQTFTLTLDFINLFVCPVRSRLKSRGFFFFIFFFGKGGGYHGVASYNVRRANATRSSMKESVTGNAKFPARLLDSQRKSL